VVFDDVLSKQRERDQRDCLRPVGALVMADDAVEVNTDGLTPQQVVDRLEQIVRARWDKVARQGSAT
jgi:cytidylate kinase